MHFFWVYLPEYLVVAFFSEDHPRQVSWFWSLNVLLLADVVELSENVKFNVTSENGKILGCLDAK